MSYISLPTLMNSRTYVSDNINKADTFAGLILYLCCVVESKRDGYYLKADMKVFSELAESAFYLSESSSSYYDKYWYALLTNDWLEQVREYFLRGNKISAKKVMYCLFWEKDFGELQSLKRLIAEDVYDAIFIDDLSEADFQEDRPIAKASLLSSYNGTQDALTIKFDGSFVKKKAGDLSGAPFGQTLYAATEIKKIISIFDFDFIEKFDLHNSAINTVNNQLYQSHCVNICKPFILLAGISGTGKTRFIRKQAEAHNVGDANFCLVPVRPDWHEPSDLLGYVSRISGTQYIATKALKFIIAAWRVVAPDMNADGMGELNLTAPPYWLCLDEMNLAPVEQYFADYLSVLESRKFENGQYTCEPLLDKSIFAMTFDNLKADLGIDAGETGLWDYFCQHGIALPPNLIVAGTVNMDETTHGFSRKVIDRAFTLDFGEFFPNDYQAFFTGQALPKVFTYSQLTHATQIDLSRSFDTDGTKTVEFLESINAVLKRTPFELAYRALNELLLHVACFNPQDSKALQAVWDDFMMTKILPRIDGDDDKLRLVRDNGPTNLLGALVEVLEVSLDEIWAEGETRVDFFRSAHDGNEINDIPCRSRLKIKWMKNRLDTNTFTSFWP